MSDIDLIKVKSCDDQIIELPRKVAEVSVLVKGLIEDRESPEDEIFLNEINKETADKVFEYCNYVLNNDVP